MGPKRVRYSEVALYGDCFLDHDMASEGLHEIAHRVNTEEQEL